MRLLQTTTRACHHGSTRSLEGVTVVPFWQLTEARETLVPRQCPIFGKRNRGHPKPKQNYTWCHSNSASSGNSGGEGGNLGREEDDEEEEEEEERQSRSLKSFCV